MSEMAEHVVHLKVIVDKKSLRALHVILDVLSDVAEDFEYRKDVKRAVRAAKHLIKNVQIGDSDAAVWLFEGR